MHGIYLLPGRPRLGTLALQGLAEAILINLNSLFPGNFHRQLKGEAKGIVKAKGFLTRKDSSISYFIQLRLEQFHARLDGGLEPLLFSFYSGDHVLAIAD